MNKITSFDEGATKVIDGECIEHPVWKVLNKVKYVEEFIPQAEKMYDFIKSVVAICGNITVDGNTVPSMSIFFNMWNEYSSETFWILDSLVNTSAPEEDCEKTSGEGQ